MKQENSTEAIHSAPLSLTAVLSIVGIYGVLSAYVYWRLTAFSQSNASLMAWLMLTAELLILGRLAWVQVLRLLREAPPERPMKITTRWPQVSVIIASEAQSEALLEVSLIAASQIDYPRHRRRIFLLDNACSVSRRFQGDSSARIEAKQRHLRISALCQRLGIELLSPQASIARWESVEQLVPEHESDFLLLFNANHIVTQNVLKRLTGHLMGNEGVSIARAAVQSPHPDPVQRQLNAVGERLDSGHLLAVDNAGATQKPWLAALFGAGVCLVRRDAVRPDVPVPSLKTIFVEQATASDNRSEHSWLTREVQQYDETLMPLLLCRRMLRSGQQPVGGFLSLAKVYWTLQTSFLRLRPYMPMCWSLW